MIKARWQGFEVESGETPISIAANWYVFKQSMIFALFTVPVLSTLGYWLAKYTLRYHDWPVSMQEEAGYLEPFEEENLVEEL